MTPPDLERLAQSNSRRAGLITAFGALLLILAFAIALWQLHRVQQQITALNQQLEDKKGQLTDMQKEVASLNHQKELLEQQNRKLTGETQYLESELRQMKRLNQRLDEAMQLQILNRDYATSRDKLTEIVQLNPQNEVACYWLAQACYRLGRHLEAITNACKAIALDTNYFDPYVPLICALHKAGHPDLALEYLQSALDRSPENLYALATRRQEYQELMAQTAYRRIIYRQKEKLQTIQQALKDLGYYAAEVDGLVGGQTKAAIQRFCEKGGIAPQLTVNELARQLALALAPSAAGN